MCLTCKIHPSFTFLTTLSFISLPTFSWQKPSVCLATVISCLTFQLLLLNILTIQKTNREACLVICTIYISCQNYKAGYTHFPFPNPSAEDKIPTLIFFILSGASNCNSYCMFVHHYELSSARDLYSPKKYTYPYTYACIHTHIYM